MQISILDSKTQVESFLDSNISVPTQHPLWSELINEYDKLVQYYYIVAHDSDEIKGVLPGFFIETKYGVIYNSLPYPGGYGGIVSNKESAYKNILKYLVNEAKDRGCLSVSISNNPWKDDYKYYTENLEPDYIFENFVNYVDLSKDLSYNKKIRWSIRKADNSNINFTDTPSLKEVKEFYNIWEDLMESYKAPHFNLDFFINVYEKLVAKNKAKFFLSRHDNKIISGYLLLLQGEVIEYFHSAIDPNYRELQPNSFLINEGMKWGKSNRMKYWNWQSTKARNSTVHKFKLGWGSEESKHFYFTKILGDYDSIFRESPENIKADYPFYFFLPYEAYTNKETTFFKK